MFALSVAARKSKAENHRLERSSHRGAFVAVFIDMNALLCLPGPFSLTLVPDPDSDPIQTHPIPADPIRSEIRKREWVGAPTLFNFASAYCLLFFFHIACPRCFCWPSCSCCWFLRIPLPKMKKMPAGISISLRLWWRQVIDDET